MNPDFLKYLQQITSSLRGGLVFNPLDELQKRAQQQGEGIGLQLEHDRAQAGYAKSHPESARAQQEMFGNAAMMALQMGKGGEAEFIPKENAAALKLGRKVFTGQTHSNAIMAAQAEGALPSWSSPSFNTLMQKAKEGFVTNTGRFLSREDAYDLQDAAGKLSGPVKAQIAERARHIPSLNNKSLDAVDVRKGLTAEDVKGKLYANRGTKADAPITGDEFDKIVEKYRKEKGKGAALDSVAIAGVNPAALKIGGAIYRGASHWPATEAAIADGALPEPTHPDFERALKGAKEGFVTNEGKFVSRSAAYKIARKAKQLEPSDPKIANSYWGRGPWKDKLATELLKDNSPTLADLDRIMAKKNKGKAALDSVPEQIISAAMKHNKTGQVFSAPVHVLAHDEAISAGLDEPMYNFEEGFLTSSGRFVDRREAQKIAKQAKQVTNKNKSGLIAGDIGLAHPDDIKLGSRLHDALTKNGGFTIDPQTGADLTSGYSVGGGEKSGVLLKKPLADLKPTELQDFLNANRSKLKPGQAWGGWVDNGHVYIEPADQVADVNEAQRIGNERGEKAIWDHANKTEIPLKAAKQEAEIARNNEFNDVLNKWRTVWDKYQQTAGELRSLQNEHRTNLIQALKNPIYK